jgi:hypothetical protein
VHRPELAPAAIARAGGVLADAEFDAAAVIAIGRHADLRVQFCRRGLEVLRSAEFGKVLGSVGDVPVEVVGDARHRRKVECPEAPLTFLSRMGSTIRSKLPVR